MTDAPLSGGRRKSRKSPDLADAAARVMSWFLRLVFVPKCQICGETLETAGELCPDCLAKWESARRSRCPVCNSTARKCTCRPISLSRTDMMGDSVMSALVFYGKYGSEDERDRTVLKTVYAVKTSPDRSCVQFAARQMAADILRLMSLSGEEPEDWRLTYPPRTSRRRRYFGFDQGRDLCRELSRYTGIPAERCFVSRGTEVQKRLNSLERRKNANSSYSLCRKADPRGKKYLIADDVITTGATVSACADILRGAGAKAVFPVCIARTKQKKPRRLRRAAKNPWFCMKTK